MGILHAKPARLASSDEAYVEVAGERMALFGRRDGSFECWMWPLLLFESLELELRRAGELAHPTAARRICVLPEGLELAYPLELAGAQGELVLEAFAARDERALVIALRLTGELEGRVELALRPALRPMWPAGLGAQLCGLDQETGALSLSEELGRFAAMIGSPRGQCLLDASERGLREEVRFRSGDLLAGEAEPFLLVIAGVERVPEPLSQAARRGGGQAACGDSRAAQAIAEARALYRRVAREWRERLERERTRWDSYLAGGAALKSDEPALDQAFLWSRIAIERSWVSVDGIGRTLVAGLGPSHGGDRPGFAWFFNGDAFVASRTLALLGDLEGARAVFRFAASTQRADGKIAHEISLSAGSASLCAWFEDYPYAYYKGQVTPGFVSCLARHVALAADIELALELMPAVRAAIDWCETTLDEEGRMRVDLAGIAAVEAGPLAGRIQSECFLQGIWISALEGALALARATRNDSLLPRYEQLLSRARAGLQSFWCEELGLLGFARLDDGQRCDDLTGYAALPLSRGQLDEARTLSAVLAMNAPELSSDWGVRMFAENAAIYDPAHYNCGSVFPYLTNFQVLALYRAGLPDAGYALLRSQVALDGFLAPGWMPEFLVGDRAACPPRAVPHQVFSQTTIQQGVLIGMLGIDGRAGDELVLAPSLPPGRDELELCGLAFRGRRLDLSLRRVRRSGETRLECRFKLKSGQALRVHFEPLLPPLTTQVRVELRGEERPFELRQLPSASLRIEGLALELRADQPLELSVLQRAGPSLDLSRATLEAGAPSSGVRLVGQSLREGALVLTLAGPCGTTHSFPLHTDLELCCGGARLDGHSLTVDFPGDSPWPRTEVRLRPITR